MNFNFGNQFCNVGIARDWKNSRKQVPDDSKNKLFPFPMSRILPIILDYLYFSILALPFSSASAVYTQRNIFSFLKNPRAATHNWRKFISAQRSKIFNEPPLARCSIKNCSCFYVLPFFRPFQLVFRNICTLIWPCLPSHPFHTRVQLLVKWGKFARYLVTCHPVTLRLSFCRLGEM